MAPSAPLAHLRFAVERSRGRRYPEFPHSYRNDFERDRDRVIHARAFRRLENKTQVFAPGISDHFRNRLTHTIEVSQIARTVARALGLNEELTEALALVHDIGHPPFAHSGEIELNRVMRRYGEQFDHNLHALRIVESFEHPYPRYPGLNLTFEVREGMVKHSRDFGPGEFAALEEYLPGKRPLIEAQIIDLADEIGYNAADLDDGYDAGLVRMEDACAASQALAGLWEEVEGHFPGASERVRLHEVVRQLMNWMVTSLIEGTLLAAARLERPEAVRENPARVVRLTPDAAETTQEIKRFLREHVYESERVAGSRVASSGRISELFDFFLTHPDRLPVVYQEKAKEEPLYRVVCDYIAGMTDGFFHRTCQQTGIS